MRRPWSQSRSLTVVRIPVHGKILKTSIRQGRPLCGISSANRPSFCSKNRFAISKVKTHCRRCLKRTTQPKNRHSPVTIIRPSSSKNHPQVTLCPGSPEMSSSIGLQLRTAPSIVATRLRASTCRMMNGVAQGANRAQRLTRNSKTFVGIRFSSRLRKQRFSPKSNRTAASTKL